MSIVLFAISLLIVLAILAVAIPYLKYLSFCVVGGARVLFTPAGFGGVWAAYIVAFASLHASGAENPGAVIDHYVWEGLKMVALLPFRLIGWLAGPA